MAVSVDEQSQQSEIRTAVAPHSDAVRTAVNSTLRSRHGATTRTAKSIHSSADSTVSNAASFDKMVSAFSAVTFSYFLLAVTLYVDFVVGVFHLAYFSYRNPSVSKDLIKTAFHLLKTSYDNKLLSLTEIYQVTGNSIVRPMARQNQAHFQDENQRTAQLETMRTSAASQQ